MQIFVDNGLIVLIISSILQCYRDLNRIDDNTNEWMADDLLKDIEVDEHGNIAWQEFVKTLMSK
jgi:Ca2+-binding EF-hand superfamily protein